MKTKLLKLAFLIMMAGVIPSDIFAQGSAGITIGATDYKGNLGNHLYSFRNPRAAATISLMMYVNPSFDLGGHFQLGQVQFVNDGENFNLEYYIPDINFKYKFNNGYLLKEDAPLSPYLFAGPGIAWMASNKTGRDAVLTFNINAGFGLDIKLSDPVHLILQSSFNMPQNSGSDGYKTSDYYDIYLQNSFGFAYNFGKSRDSDGDGIPDKKDKCENSPPGSRVDANGCPMDTDGDGVADIEDKCPKEAGSAALKGCPDTDKDGVADIDDQCPNEAGTLATNGCPDADGDGVMDSKDKCPNDKGNIASQGCPDRDGDGVIDGEDSCPDVKGPASSKGCPDTDGDGVNDEIDKCPKVAGSKTHFGCPDTDGDGVYDDIDKCIGIPGVASNQGCPEIKKETKQLFEKALQGIQFETGKAVIKPVSFPIMNAIVKVMNENPSYKLIIGGHTDNVGDDQMNQTLSENRAASVANYLITAGVDPLRISAEGFGENQPVDTNDTAAGKTRNRRVEFKVEFLQ